MIHNLDTILELSKSKKRKKIAVVWALGDELFEALSLAYSYNIIEPILIGPIDEIQKVVNINYPLLNEAKTIEAVSEEDAAKIAVNLAKNNEVDIIMKGLLDTNKLLKAVVNREEGIREEKLLSHVALISYPNLNRVLFCSDVAMNIEPSIEEKVIIIENLIKVANCLGIRKPKIGIVSSIEKVNPKIKSSVDAMELVERFKDNNYITLDGPFAIDNLVSLDAAREKNITSPVAGLADGLIFPNIDAGNIFYKTSLFLGGASAAGIIVGAKVPIVLTSRADSVKSKLYSIALAVMVDEL